MVSRGLSKIYEKYYNLVPQKIRDISFDIEVV